MTSARLWALTAIVAGLLLATIAFAALRLNWHLGGHTSVLPLRLDAPDAPQGDAPQRGLDAIVALAPFGQAATAERAPQATTSRLDAVLRGVLVDPDPANSRAFVLAAGKTSVLRVGDTLQAAELVAVNAATVTFKSDAGLIVLGFGGIETGADDAPQSESSAAEDASDPFARLASAIVAGQGSIDLRDAPPPETTDAYIDLWRDRIALNPQSAMDTVGIELVENGYRIKPDPNIGVTLAGLKPGDVITRLNGQTVGDLETDRQLYDEVAASGIARLEVVRNGQSLLLTFPLR